MRRYVAFTVGLMLSIRVFAATCLQAPAVPKDPKQKEDTCRISGMVVKAADGAPLKGAGVSLRNNEDREHNIATTTTADGHFVLQNVPAGHYKLFVNRNGYVPQAFGQRKPNDPGATFTLSPGQTKTDVTFRLIPSAVISGRVFDGDGEPVPHASVTAWRETYDEGRKTIGPVTHASTDDLGAFRLFGLSPGRYFVSALEPGGRQLSGDREFSGAVGESAEQGYAKTYYPGTADISRAAAILVKEGDEIPSVDIGLKEITVHRIRGKVLNQLTHKPGEDVWVLLIPRTKLQEWDSAGQTLAKKADGSFEIANVAPGPYTIVAYWSDQGKIHSAVQKVEVGERDVEDVLLTLSAGATVQGRILWDGKPSMERDELSVYTNATDMTFNWGVGEARVDSNQQFTLKGLTAGDVRMQISGASKDCYIKQIAYGQTFIKDDVISIANAGNPALEITLSSRGARVQGSVVDKDNLPSAGVWVVAVPDEARRTILRLFKSQTTDQYGKFDLHGLAPGTYKLFAWDGTEGNAWEDEDFLKLFEDQGTKIELRDEDVVTTNLTVISAKREGND